MGNERRAHARIAAPLSARIVVGTRELELVVRDVSRGGIFLYTQHPPGKVGTPVSLKLSRIAGIKPLVLEAEIVRIIMDLEERGGAVLGMALQFLDVTPEQEKLLLELLDRAMMGVGTHNRAFPRVACLLDITFHTPGELKALMRDIGEGGIGLSVDRAFQLNEEISVEVAQATQPSLHLVGWVVSCESLPSDAGFFRVGVRFRLSPAARNQLQGFLKKLYRE